MMKKGLVSAAALFLTAAVLTGCGAEVPKPVDESTAVDAVRTAEGKDGLNEEQKNAFAMLNYLTVISQEIIAAQDNRPMLEELCTSLLNDINPEKVDGKTKEQLKKMQGAISGFEQIGIEKDRALFLYEQGTAETLEETVTDRASVLLDRIDNEQTREIVTGILSKTVSTASKVADKAITIGVASMEGKGLEYLTALAGDLLGADSSYENDTSDADAKYRETGWKLDDDSRKQLKDTRVEAFNYMIDIVNEYSLDGKLALNEEAVGRFVDWKNNKNVVGRIQFLESEVETYRAFGGYWLTLAESYCENGDYQKCLNAIHSYESLRADIFRRDYAYAHAMPSAISAACALYEGKQFVSVAEKYLDVLTENMGKDDWSLRYFAAQVCLDFYGQTNDRAYLERAYEIVKNNVNSLVPKQRALNEAWLAPVKEVAVTDQVKDEKKQIEAYNKSLNERRKTELAPVYEPLVLNCQLLFGLADELAVDSAEKAKLEGILRGKDGALFLSAPVERRYTFGETTLPSTAQYKKDQLILPAACVTESTVIKVTVDEAEIVSNYKDWTLSEVRRDGKTPDSFTAVYESKAASKQKWSADSKVKVELFDDEKSAAPSQTFTFKVSKYQKVLVLETVEFEQVG